MPFKSRAQERLMWAKHPKIARRWEDESHTDYRSLPEKKKPEPPKKKYYGEK